MIIRKSEYIGEMRDDVACGKSRLTSGACLARAVSRVDVTAESAEPLPVAYGDTE